MDKQDLPIRALNMGVDLDYANPSATVGVAGGTLVTIAGIPAITNSYIRGGETGSARNWGQASALKAGIVITDGDKVGWNNNGSSVSGVAVAGCLTNVAADVDTWLGVAVETTTAADATQKLLLNRYTAAEVLSTLANGTSSAPTTDATPGGSIVSLFVNPTVLSHAGEYMTIRAESYYAGAETFTLQGSGIFTGRFKTGVAATKTFKGSANQGYLVGVQGKLDNLGIIGNGNSDAIYCAAGLSQVSGAGTYGADAQLYGHWIDFQAGMGATPTLTHMLNMTNNSGQTIANAIKIYGGGANQLTNLLNIEQAAGAVVAVTGTGTLKTGALRVIVGPGCTIAAGTYYVPLISALN